MEVRKVSAAAINFREVDIEKDVRRKIWSSRRDDMISELCSELTIEAAAKRHWISVKCKAAG